MQFVMMGIAATHGSDGRNGWTACGTRLVGFAVMLIGLSGLVAWKPDTFN